MGHLNLDADHTIYYEWIEGNPDAPCLVFLHEGLGCISMWGDFPRQLCRRTGCPGLAYDRTGYGRSAALRSDRTIHYLHEYALDELPGVINGLIPGRPFFLIGHSDGGSISLIYGAQRPALLKGIVTEAAHVFVEPETIEGIKRADQAFDQGKLAGLFRYHGDKTRRIFKAWSDTWLSHWFYHWNIEYLLPSIKSEMLIIQGMDDPYGTQGQVDSIQKKSAGRAESCLIENCGHSPHSDQSEIVIEKISGFMETLKC